DHVILIDDAREFTGNNNYPTLEELRQILKNSRREWQMTVDADVIRIHKRSLD
ncbi:MAG: FkbM family methyltransferase, partial [Deltaproteobacteria bacterium]|nr:FkbM family methyltransferase [Deltaproteobacteria bacterium]